MIVANFVSNRPTMSETRTYEDFYKFLGTRPTKLGVVSRLYPELTASYLTESLRNIFYQDGKSGNKYQSIDAMYFEWEVETNYIKRVEFADVPTEDGAGGTEIVMAFKERYYEKYDIFKIDKTMQQCIVVSRPVRKADNYWEVVVRLIDNDYSSVLDLSGCQVGDTTRFQSNAMPEMHEEGYVKYQSNIEKHRNFITTHRCDDSYSALYAAHENVFISIAEGKDTGSLKETLYKMDKKEKVLLDNFLYVRNNGLLFNKSNVDVNGKPTICDPDTKRPIYIGDGIIPQVERFASKYAFAKLSIDVFQTVLATMNEKATNPTGNKYVFICNERMWFLIQNVLGDFLAKYKTIGTYLWSKAANDYIKVGATFNSYEYGGNEISFKVDRTFSREYGMEKAYCLCLDLTADATSAEPPIQMFTLKGGDFITNKYPGVGGLDGLSSGVVSSPVAASKLINWGYSGVGVFNPYRSFILREL
nr:MAG TPA: major capsid protein [Caudoviricetes sp.]